MSSDIGNALGWGLALKQSDNSACTEEYFGNDDLYQPDPLVNLYVREDLWYGVPTFRTPWWPRGGSWFAGDSGTDQALAEARWWGDFWPNLPGGCNGRLGFAGYTRDAYGSILANCTVRLFRTATNELQAIVTSDANGYYIATTPYYEAHFMTVHKSGSPEVCGASVSDLLPG